MRVRRSISSEVSHDRDLPIRCGATSQIFQDERVPPSRLLLATCPTGRVVSSYWRHGAIKVQLSGCILLSPWWWGISSIPQAMDRSGLDSVLRVPTISPREHTTDEYNTLLKYLILASKKLRICSLNITFGRSSRRICSRQFTYGTSDKSTCSRSNVKYLYLSGVYV